MLLVFSLAPFLVSLIMIIRPRRSESSATPTDTRNVLGDDARYPSVDELSQSERQLLLETAGRLLLSRRTNTLKSTSEMDALINAAAVRVLNSDAFLVVDAIRSVNCYRHSREEAQLFDTCSNRISVPPIAQVSSAAVTVAELWSLVQFVNETDARLSANLQRLLATIVEGRTQDSADRSKARQ